MSKAQPTVMDILVHLDRSNCRECGAATCMAFAALVVQGQKRLAECPRLDPGVIEKLACRAQEGRENAQGLRDERIDELKARIRDVDLPSAARRAGCVMKGDRVINSSIKHRQPYTFVDSYC